MTQPTSNTPMLAKYGQCAVVTGASDGIAKAFAIELAANKLNLVLAARRAVSLHTLATELSAAHGVQCQVVIADFAQSQGNGTLFERTAALDVGLLVAAAGFGTSGAFLAGDLADGQNLLAVNCAAVLEQSWHFAQRFATQGRGGIVLMSSLLAFQGTPRSANYAASKAYVQSLAEALRVELKPAGVTVIASAPGPIHSGFAARANIRMSQALTRVWLRSKPSRLWVSALPSGRAGYPSCSAGRWLAHRAACACKSSRR